jgi:AraC family transcriptional activator of tynA and feaB
MNQFGSGSLEEYRRRVGQVFYPLQPRASKDCRLSIRDFTSRRAGEFRFTSSAMDHATPIGGVRQWRHIDRGTPDEFVLIVADTTALRYTQFRRQVDLPAGSMMLLDARNPYEYERCFSGRVTCYHMPGRVLRQTLPVPEDHCAIRIDATGGVGAALRSFIGLAWDYGARDPDRRDGLFRDTAALISVATQAPTGHRHRAGCRPGPMERAEAFIDANLDTDLSVTRIARAAGISASRLQTLARGRDLSVGRLVLGRRLDACAAALVLPDASGRRLIDVALEHGFVSQSHFSRAFRQRFGCAPSQYARTRAG